MTNDDNDDDADDSDFDDTLGEILGTSFMATPSLDLDLCLVINLSLSPTGVKTNQNQEKLVVCRERADTEAYVSGSKPLNHFQMMDLDQ